MTGIVNLKAPNWAVLFALAAGLHAVFLFHKDTWVLEHAALDTAPEGQHLIELDSFAKLATLF